MRRTLPVLITATLLFAACGSDDSATDSTTADTTETGGTTETGDTTPGTTVPVVNPDKPVVEIPEEIPTELTVEVLEPGEGPEAQVGDTVIVDYVGVRSRDGVEFDNSYDARQPGVPPSPFAVSIGAEPRQVIEGWDVGLVGAQAGSQIQIDIPSEQAYGEESSGEIIGPNEALSFVIDVRAVVTPSSPADAPTEPGVDASTGATEIMIEDLVEGTGTTVEDGQFVVIDYVLFRADNGAVLVNAWGADPTPLPLVDGIFPVFLEALPGMKVGGQRAITFPPDYPDYGFGPEGRPTEGLPANTDIVIVVDMLAAWGGES